MGVRSIPISTIPITVCNHRYGAEATYTEQTDARFLNSCYAVELYGFRNNFRIGMFTAGIIDDLSGIGEAEATGLIRHDIYHYTDYWVSPVTGMLEQIPDYYSSTWTSAGAAVFSGAVSGQPKPVGSTPTRYPGHGQEMYTISGGDFGYDYVNSVSGSSNQSELIGLIEYQKNILKNLVNRNASAASYRNGRIDGAISTLPYYLGVRTSATTSRSSPLADTWYGNGLGYSPTGYTNVTRSILSVLGNSSRYWDAITSDIATLKPLVDAWLTTEVQSTITNNGWFRDFTHWHQLVVGDNLTYMDQYMAVVKAAVGSSFVWYCSVGEALEYLMLRTITDKVSCIEVKTGKIAIVVDVIDSFKGSFTNGISNDVNLDTISIPLSVEVDLTGTSLAGVNIKSSYGKIRSLGSNVYVVQIPFSKREGFQSVSLIEGEDGIYTETIPTESHSVGSGVLSMTTNIATKAVLFSVATGGDDFDSLPIARSNEFSLEHIFNVPAGNDYRVGIISEFGQSDLITI